MKRGPAKLQDLFFCIPAVDASLLKRRSHGRNHCPCSFAGEAPRRCARLSTRVDLAPMVDLGFLLITFFIFTTRLSQPMTINLVMPANGDIPASKTVKLVLEAENRVFYYPGAEVWNQNCTDFSPTGLRKLLLETQQKLRKHNRENGSLDRFDISPARIFLYKPGGHNR